MVRSEAKAAMRTTARPSSSWKQSGYAAQGVILGFVLVLLYLMVSSQLSYNNPREAAYAGATTISTAEKVPARRQRSYQEHGSRSTVMEELGSSKEVAEPRTDPSTISRRKETHASDEQEWEDKNLIEEQSVGNERNTDNWNQTHEPTDKDIVGSTEFGGGTDDFNNIVRTKPICRAVDGQVRGGRPNRAPTSRPTTHYSVPAIIRGPAAISCTYSFDSFSSRPLVLETSTLVCKRRRSLANTANCSRTKHAQATRGREGQHIVVSVQGPNTSRP